MASICMRSLGVASRQMSTTATPRMNLAQNVKINVQFNGQFTSTQPVGDSPSLRRYSSKKIVQGVAGKSLEVLLSKALKGDSPLVQKTQQILSSIGIGNIDQLSTLNRSQLEKIGLQISVIDAIESSIRLKESKSGISLEVGGMLPMSNASSTLDVPQAPVLEMVYEGSKNPFLFKSNEQFWKDLEDNLQETNWMRSEQASNSQLSLQWYKDWKNRPVQSDRSYLRPMMKVIPSLLKTEPMTKADVSGATILSTKNKNENSQIGDHKSYLTKLGVSLGVKHLDDWYHVSILNFKKSDNFAPQFLSNYQNSLIKALITLIPENNWKIWKFEVPFNGFSNEELISQDSSEEYQKIQEEDWRTTMNRYKDHWQVTLFSTSKGDSLANQASPFMRAKNSLEGSGLEDISGVYSKQKELRAAIKELLPSSKIVSNFTNPLLVYSDTKRPFSLNCYLPEHNLSFEVIEDPNFSWQYAFGADIPIYTFNKAKRAICEKYGIDMIQVPTWWDSKNSMSHLINAIKRIRPNVVLSVKSDEIVKITSPKNPSEVPTKSDSDKEELKEELHVERV